MSQRNTIDKAYEAVTASDFLKIHKIAKRAAQEFGADQVSTDLDLLVVHANVGLRLDELLEADVFNFIHDISGIDRHLDRETGELTGHFLPRFSSRGVAA